MYVYVSCAAQPLIGIAPHLVSSNSYSDLTSDASKVDSSVL